MKGLEMLLSKKKKVKILMPSLLKNRNKLLKALKETQIKEAIKVVIVKGVDA